MSKVDPDLGRLDGLPPSTSSDSLSDQVPDSLPSSTDQLPDGIDVPDNLPDVQKPDDSIDPDLVPAADGTPLSRTQYFSRQSGVPVSIPSDITTAMTSKKPRVKEFATRAMLFLKTLALTTNVAEALRTSGLPMKTAYDWKEKNPDFSDAWDDAITLGYEGLRAEAIRRGRDGVLEPVYQKGVLVGHKRTYSDNLTMFMLKARHPDEFREKETGKDSGITINYNIQGITRDPHEAAKYIDVDVTNPLPDEDDEDKPPRN